jgi:HK97 family phage prohead protease
MPYFITDSSPDCSGWATIKEDDEVIGCHENKQDAIDQMIAVSIAEDIEPGGERLKYNKKNKMKYRVLPDNYRPSLSEDVPEGRACGNCIFYKEDDVKEFADGELRAWCEKWDDYVNGAYYCNAWQPVEEETRAPAPAKDQIVGSDKNKPDSAKGPGGDIDFDEKTETGLRNKVKEHNEDMASKNKPDWTRTTLGQLKAVYRRGSGAYSTSHRPGISRAAWSMARVNAFLYLLRNGRPANKNYITDNDLLPKGHPRSSRDLRIESGHVPDVVSKEEERQVNLTPPAYMRAAARRGLELNRQGFGGDGLTDKTKQEARNMASGQVSEDKWRRIAPWIARHLVDLDAPSNSNQSDPGYPGAGLVAHLLWGSGPSKAQARRTMEYAQGVVDRLNAEEEQSRWSSIHVNLRQQEEGSPMTKVERRVKTDINFELRMDDVESDGMRFSGYAAVFNSESEPLPFVETIMPGAFSRSLKSRNEVKLFKNHNMDEVLASTRSKTLKLLEDDNGLLAEATLPDTTAGRDLAVLMKRGDVHAMSFGFSVPRGGDKYSDDGKTRTLKEIRLHEVSIVTGFPAYQATTASVRSLDILATRTKVDVDDLADVMLKLEAGETLKDKEASLINEVVNKLREDKPSEKDLLNIKRQQLDLLYKMV